MIKQQISTVLLTEISTLNDLAKPNFKSLEAKFLRSCWQGKRLIHPSFIKGGCEEFVHALPLVRNFHIHCIAVNVVTPHRL